MSNSFLTHRSLLALSRRLLVSGLCLGLLGTVGATVRSHLLVAPAVAEAKIASTKNITAEDLIGEWQGELAPGQTITWIFTPDGKLFMTAPPPPDEQQHAIEMRYQVNASSQPMGIDIDLMKGATVKTILEFTDASQMKIQIAGTMPGQERPTAFNNATTFKKVSGTTTLPLNTEIDEFDTRS